MPTREAEPLLDLPLKLGEGPAWARGELAFVDIQSCAAFLHRAGDRNVRTARFGAQVGAILPRASGGWIAAVRGRGLVALDGALNETGVFCHPEGDRPENRYNDGAIDPAGRLWIGTMNTDGRSPTGALYRVDADGRTTRVLDGLTISNGLAWSPSGATMYHIDSPTRRVEAYAFDVRTGDVEHERTLAELDDGYPDGMTTDAEGGVWVARWAGGRVSRFDPGGGAVTDEVTVPAKNATACCFAGGALDRLVITTAEDDTPRAGGVFAVRTGRVGMEPGLFAG